MSEFLFEKFREPLAKSNVLEGERDGPTIEQRDSVRLNEQQMRVYRVMKDGRWWPLQVIRELTGDSDASVSARIRDFRKERFGGHTVKRRRHNNTFEYRLIWNEKVARPE